MLKRILAYIMALCLLASASVVFTSCDIADDISESTTESSQTAVPDTDGTDSDGTSETVADTEPPEAEPASIKFSVFSDFHYKVGMYISSIADMDAITKRANESSVDFLMQTGDFCNDYAGSPELMNAYLKNQYGIPAYGVFGNHEMESANSMSIVVPIINSEPDAVTWGTADGKMGDKSIGHYYFEVNGFRIICLDANYSYNPEKAMWERNHSNSSGAPTNNINKSALGPEQEEWLKKVLNDAADKNIPCVIFSHVGFSGAWSSAYNHKEIRALFSEVNERVPGTVMAAFSGHLHTNHGKVIDGVYYMDVNAARNICWRGSQKEHHYTTETFSKVNYDANGTRINAVETYVKSLSQAKNTWFSTDPLSCIVTISRDGTITIEGMETTWLNDIAPSGTSDAIAPKILSGSCTVPGKKD